MKQAYRDSAVESKKNFKIESVKKIKEHEKIIEKCKEKNPKENITNYKAELAKLESKYRDLKKKINSFNEKENNQWMTFMSEFSSDLEAFEKELELLASSN